ncbi:hypothetical protein [Streptomyces sp. NPDC093598]|uniref:hypothetical protein n=1 Tax=Streptomyces sp. NPDC093598 TaxID=3366046 RepID=UPI0038277866
MHAVRARLPAAAARHRTDHEFHHVALDIARWSREHATRLADTGRDHGLDLSGPRGKPSPGALAALREKASEALGRRPETGLRAQAAQATRDERLWPWSPTAIRRRSGSSAGPTPMIRVLAPRLLTSV